MNFLLKLNPNLHFSMVVLQFPCAFHVLLDLVGSGVDRCQRVMSERLGVVSVRQRRLEGVAQVFDRVEIPKNCCFLATVKMPFFCTYFDSKF
jgi:hypothetical protein